MNYQVTYTTTATRVLDIEADGPGEASEAFWSAAYEHGELGTIIESTGPQAVSIVVTDGPITRPVLVATAVLS